MPRSLSKMMSPDTTKSNEVERPLDPGLAALAVIARFHEVHVDEAQLRHTAALSTRADRDTLVRTARSLGLKAKSVPLDPTRLSHIPLPALVLDRDGAHFVLARCDGDSSLVLNPNATTPTVIATADIFARSAGQIILFTSRASLVGNLAAFDFSWFIPAIIRYRALLLEAVGLSFILQFFGLVTPMLFQVVMDKVLVSHTQNTLNVVCIALLISAIFETLLAGIRNFTFSHTANRIDVELGTRLFRHLVALPLPYFVTRRVGDTVARVRELESIRNFLTGQAITAAIDFVFSIVFLAVMCIYSVWLTLIVAASLPVYAAISFLITPILRTCLDEKFARGADNQSFLVESVSGIETVKAMALEPQFIRRWETQLAGYVSAGFRVTSLGNIGQQIIQLVGKLVTVATLFLGARLVIDGKLTVGALIAFNMMSQRVAAPVLRLAQLWQDFQQVGISMKRLGDILNTRTEAVRNRAALPPIRGDIHFDNVRFRYRVDGSVILEDLSFTIKAGQVIGIVGRSGSGKSTLTKLLQRLYLPEHGTIRVDGVDLVLADPTWLRRQVGVVLQENRLFNRSVRENIGLADPAAPLEAIIHAAKLAGAHEFICELKEGYDTLVGENGSTLSGGQRQRLAIARALLTNPRILIFDEATSALDFETERIIQDNMRAICEGRTVLIIAHRLTAVRHADLIIAMDKGKIVERGNHDDLIARQGYYAGLVSLQNS